MMRYSWAALDSLLNRLFVDHARFADNPRHGEYLARRQDGGAITVHEVDNPLNSYTVLPPGRLTKAAKAGQGGRKHYLRSLAQTL